MKKWVMMVAAICLAVTTATMARASDKDWSFEITPYAWLMGIDADVTVGNRKIDVDKSFSDLIDHVDVAASLFIAADYKSWVFWSQVDYFSVSEDGNTALGDAKLDSDTTFLAAGVGYRLPGLFEGITIDVLLGARYVHMSNKLEFTGLVSTSGNADIVDPILILRPSIPIIGRLRFNSTMSIGGGGDSNLIYELQPQLQYRINDTFAARLGYRCLYYDYEGDNTDFDGTFQGFILGLGLTL